MIVTEDFFCFFYLIRAPFIGRKVEIQAQSSDPNTWAKLKHIQGLASAVQELRSKLEQHETEIQSNNSKDLAATIGLGGAVGITTIGLILYVLKQYLLKKLQKNKTLTIREQGSLPLGFYTEG